MSSLTVEQVRELTERINERFAEFDVEGSRMFESVTPGMARLVFDVIGEWSCGGDIAMRYHEGFLSGFERGRASMRAELGLLEGAGGRVGVVPNGELTDDEKRKLRAIAAEVEKIHAESERTDPDQIRADIRDLGAAYPSLDDVITPEVTVQCAPDVIESLPEPTIMPKPTNGNGHHAELSPATTATLGPEHTVVTPLVPRRPRTLAEVDGIEDDETDSRPTRAKLPVVTREQLIAELKRQAMAGAMPTRPAFDLAKPAVWPMSQMLLKRFDTTWANLADEAGLRLVRS